MATSAVEVTVFFVFLRRNFLRLHRYRDMKSIYIIIDSSNCQLIKMEVKNVGYSASFLKRQIENINSTIKKVKEISSKVRHRGVERVNKVARFEVEIKHTNEVTLELGNGYWAELTAQRALKVLQVKLQHYTEQLTKLQASKTQANEKAQEFKKLGKQKLSKLQDGKAGLLQVIGNEDGEDIFNIVEIQQENDEPFQYKPKENKNITQIEPTSIKEKPLNVQKVEKEQQIEKSQQSEKEEEVQQQQQAQLNNDQEWDEEQDDLLQEIMTRNMQSEPQKQQKIEKSNLKTIPEEKEQPQKKAEVSFGTNVNKNNDQKKNTSEVKKNQAVNDALPAKISKFKLQKMKQRLLKQIE